MSRSAGMRPVRGRPGEAGFSLVALVAGMTIMFVLMSAAVPTWRYVMKDMREEELLFRGFQIADAITRYQAKNGNAYPPSLEALVEGRYLRKPYTDPMTKDGKWHLIRPGEVQPGTVPGLPQGRSGVGGLSPLPRPSPSASPSPSAFGNTSRGGPTFGGFMGVRSTSKEESLRVFNGETSYEKWRFLAGRDQPRMVGKDRLLAGPVPH